MTPRNQKKRRKRLDILPFAPISNISTSSTLWIAFILSLLTTVASARRNCASNVCFNGGTCVVDDTAGIFQCECRPGFSGTLCESAVTCSLECRNGGVCNFDEFNRERCECPKGLSGDLCTGTTNCQETGCSDGEVCLLDARSSEWSCKIDFCVRDAPCLHNATCRPTANAFLCECPLGFSGRTCANDIDECVASGIDPCQNDGLCINTPGSFRCECVPGYSGDRCEQRVGYCLANPCGTRGDCIELATAFKCECYPGWTGKTCDREAPMCQCENERQECAIRDGQVKCSCPEGLTGSDCDQPIDLCAKTNPCANGGQCIANGNATFCLCPSQFTGSKCEAILDECQVEGRGCLNGGKCARDDANNPAETHCECVGKFFGKWCEQMRLNPTLNMSNLSPKGCPKGFCGKGGFCKIEKGKPKCACDSTHKGARCENSIASDPCHPNPCRNEGECVVEVDKAVCYCPDAFTGPTCEIACSCGPNELCRATTTGAECIQVPEPEILTPDNMSDVDSESSQRENLTKSVQTFDVLTTMTPVSKVTAFGRNTFSIGAITDQTDDPTGLLNLSNHPSTVTSAWPTRVPGSENGIFVTETMIEVGSTSTNAPKIKTTKTTISMGGMSDSGSVFTTPATFVENNDNLKLTTDSNLRDLTLTPIDVSSLTTKTISKLTSLPSLRNGDDGLLNVTSCDECVNAHRCLEMDARFVCLCESDYTGAYCDEPSTPCATFPCQNGQICRLQRSGRIDLPVCGCPPGFTGSNCATPTTAGFSPVSAVIYQVPDAKARITDGFSLIFSLRTTLTEAHVASGDNLLGKTQFRMGLRDGRLHLSLPSINNDVIDVFNFDINDAEWYTVWFNVSATANVVTVEIEDATSGYVLTRKSIPLTKQLRIFTTRFGKIDEKETFTGCLRDASINGAFVDLMDSARSVDVAQGCSRRVQCTTTTCVNGATCIDLWDAHKCQCVRPYLEPNCATKLTEVTFGHDNASSFSEYAITNEDAQRIRENTEVSFLLRTNRPSGVVFFLGNKSDDEDSVGTFLGTEIINGKIVVSGRLGGKKATSEASTFDITDNQAHLVELIRSGNVLRLKIDGKLDGNLNFRHPFEHPLLADSLILGDKSLVKQNAAFSPESEFFKGTLQDFRINGRSVILADDAPMPSELETFAEKQFDQNILEGTISDDVCSTWNPCQRGSCFNTFNDYECHCEPGWIGRNCAKKDYCADAPCPGGTNCINSHGGFVCVSTATFAPTSVAKYGIWLPEGAGLTVPKHEANFTISLKTRSIVGQVFKLQASTDSVALHLTPSGIDVIYSNSSSVMHDPIAATVSNGVWHNLTIRESIEGSQLELVFDGMSMPLLTPFVIGQFLRDRNARVILGKGFNQTAGFKGCLRGATFGPMPMLSFLGSESFGGNLQKFAHFVPQGRENLRTDGCHGSNVCGALNPCRNDATCIDLFNLRQCRCPLGFEGNLCEINVNECALLSNPCNDNGRCIDGINSHSCVCRPGFSGERCNDAVDHCSFNPCQNGATCTNQPNGTYSCDCDVTFFGHRCQQKKSVTCSARPCENGGTCSDGSINENHIQCTCPSGFTGPLCEDAIDPCADLPCLNGGKCLSAVGTELGFECQCPSQFSGTVCADFVDACHPNSENSCIHGTCSNVYNGAICTCEPGYTGPRCDIDIDECIDFPCENNGTCVNTAGGFTCNCGEYFLGEMCEIVGICATLPCMHGSCLQHSAMDHTCSCDKGYKGPHCDEQIDYCLGEPCLNGATCQKLIGAFACHCIAGFTGETCATDIDDCVPGACANGGKCIDRVNGFECACNRTGFRGAQCTEDIDECSVQHLSAHCIHGVCSNAPGTYRCQCEDGYIGPKCNMVNPCLPDAMNRTLHNCVHGKCVEPIVVTLVSGREVAQHECDCIEGFTGPQCTHLIEKQKSIALGYILGPVAAILIVLLLLGCMLFFFVARNKRANQGHYSPSGTEVIGNGPGYGVTGPRMQPFADVHNGSPKNAPTAKDQTLAGETGLKQPYRTKRAAPPPPSSIEERSNDVILTSSVAGPSAWSFVIRNDDDPADDLL